MKGSRGVSLPAVGLGTARRPVGPLGMGAGAVGVGGWGQERGFQKTEGAFPEETEAQLDVALGAAPPLQFVVIGLAHSLPTQPLQPPPPDVVVSSAPGLWRGSRRSGPGSHRESVPRASIRVRCLSGRAATSEAWRWGRDATPRLWRGCWGECSCPGSDWLWRAGGAEPSWWTVLSAPASGWSGLRQGPCLSGACVLGHAPASCLRGEVRDPALGIFHDLPSQALPGHQGWPAACPSPLSSCRGHVYAELKAVVHVPLLRLRSLLNSAGKVQGL